MPRTNDEGLETQGELRRDPSSPPKESADDASPRRGVAIPTASFGKRRRTDATTKGEGPAEVPADENPADEKDAVVVEGDLIVEGDVVVAGRDEVADPEASDEGFPTERES
jgi:hypothetical protein